jgi:SsrA-binding protein
MKKKETGHSNIIATNRRASFDYTLERSFQAGIVLVGSEIKSVRAKNINLREGYIQERDGELWLLGVHISPYERASTFDNNDPLRPRKLLLHRKEIDQIVSRSREKGYTIVPVRAYFERGRAKVEIALAKGKRQFDKREAIAKRDAERAMRRAYKEDL